MAEELLCFEDRAAFRAWLEENVGRTGVWLVFGKRGGPRTLTAAQALEEALCFGWIDGQMESLGEDRYRKYFAPRGPRSKWSEKNRGLAARLEAEGRMTDHGRRRIDEAKARGTYEGAPREAITGAQVEALRDALRPYEAALAGFDGMTPSAQRAYTGGYFAVKTEAGRQKKLAGLVERLELGLNPMESLVKRKAEAGKG
ncbi:YdeI/OmpD-associated family protein [Eubacteriales bacterium OttesenSCG-928-A19]|nr:YdeI/OmpD-associated family protein [Eubacteriales bacterium OttesenSCG-928-A19]